MEIEQCLIIIKPDGLIKSLTGNIMSVLSETQLKIVGARILKVSQELAKKHYSELREEQVKKFGKDRGTEIFENTVNYIMGKFHTDRVMVLVYHGENAIAKIRKLVGKTNPEEADPTSIRGKYGRINSKTGVFENVIHASDSQKNAEKEIKLWFTPDQLSELIYPITTEKTEIERTVWK
ncbi:MAG: nucleoside-diphosphate kinase [Candidatus Nanoarchaeia archaeon]|nr:nucleoside-diphosphate kinase [Candidatus Nanoarchaeia archaeon]MDD5741209.1 nucleoside-diphosphate kinase [Candidatus Nanoarchaeia archaeon]